MMTPGVTTTGSTKMPVGSKYADSYSVHLLKGNAMFVEVRTFTGE
jgi:hypothetical protein